MSGKKKPTEMDNRGSIEIYFKYKDGALNIRLVNANLNHDDGVSITELKPLSRKDFPGYSRFRFWRITKRSASIEKSIQYSAQYAAKGKFIASMDQAMPGLCKKPVEIPDKYMDKVTRELAWYSIKELILEPEIEPTYKKVVEYREFFRENMETLSDVARIANGLRLKSEAWKMPLCFPDILGRRDNLVMFEDLQPVHLIGEVKKDNEGNESRLKAEDLVPVNYLPPLNGNMFVFTGQNAGGKSAAEETILNAIYLAQSGLPVFADKFTLNIKQIIGLLFIDRGDGSTAELLLTKTKAILEMLEKAPENGVVLILDEVGGGTQEISGYEYGKKLLNKLAQSHCSVVLNTQIQDLAQFAQDTLGAQCFNFDLEHQIKPGIGTGGLDRLMDKVGITKLLS